MTIYKTPAITSDSLFEQSLFKDVLAATVTATIQSAITSLDTNTINYLNELLYDVTAEMQDYFDRRITPYYEAKTFKRAYVRQNKNYFYDPELGVYVLTLDRQHGDDVLEIDSVSWNGTTVTASYYDLPYVNQANHELHIDPDANLASLDDFSDYVTVTGYWGYHDNWSNAWADTTDTVQDSPLTAAATTLNVSDGTLFETYQLIKIEDEYLFITSISSNALTVERGVNGTTAASHVSTTAIYKYVPMPSVAKELRRMVIRSFVLRNPTKNVWQSEFDVKELGEGAFKKVLPYRRLIGVV